MMSEKYIVSGKITTNDNLIKAIIDSKGEVVLIYTNQEESQKFSAGIISEIFENQIILNHYLANGQYDGYMVKQIDTIFKIERGSKYTDKIEKLSHIHQELHETFELIEDDGFLTLLTYAHHNDKVVSVELINSENDDAVGFVEKIDQNSCTITVLNEYGENDGSVIFLIDDITHLTCDGDNEIVLKQLHNISAKA